MTSDIDRGHGRSALGGLLFLEVFEIIPEDGCQCVLRGTLLASSLRRSGWRGIHFDQVSQEEDNA